MSAYMIVLDSEILDPEGLASISGRLAASVEAHGGKYLIRSEDVQAQRSDESLARMAVAEFDSVEAVEAMFDSESYAELRELRRQYVRSSAFVVDGV